MLRTLIAFATFIFSFSFSSTPASAASSWNPGSGVAPFTYDQAYDIPVAKHSKASKKRYLCGDQCAPGEGEAIEAHDAYVGRQYKLRQAHGNTVCRQFDAMIRSDAAQSGITLGSAVGSHCSEEGAVGYNVMTNQGECTLITNTANAYYGEANARLLCGQNEYGKYPQVIWQKSYGRFGYNTIDVDIQRGGHAVFSKTQKRHSK